MQKIVLLSIFFIFIHIQSADDKEAECQKIMEDFNVMMILQNMVDKSDYPKFQTQATLQFDSFATQDVRQKNPLLLARLQIHLYDVLLKFESNYEQKKAFTNQRTSLIEVVESHIKSFTNTLNQCPEQNK